LPFFVLWDNATRFVFTLAAAIVGLVAYYLLPSRAQIEQKLTESYDRWKKWVLFIVAFLVLALAGVLGWELFRYKVQNGWVEVNLALYSMLGVILLVANILTLRAVKNTSEQVEIVEAEMVEHHEALAPTPAIALADASDAREEQSTQPFPPPPPSG